MTSFCVFFTMTLSGVYNNDLLMCLDPLIGLPYDF